MSFFESLILGIIQGLTEFLPVSSSGHLEIFSHIFGITDPEANLSFAIAVHGGTVLSTIVVFRKQILYLLKGLFKFEMNDQTKFMLKIFVSLIPLAIIGLTLKDSIEGLFGGSLTVVGSMLLLTSILLYLSYKAKPRFKSITYKDAFIIGIAQSLAVMPGLSRSGSTISTALLLGDKREEASSFSFLMVLIPIIGMNAIDILKGDMSESSLGIIPIITGFLAAFITGTIACKLMIRIVNKGKLLWFSVYCFVVGLAVVIYSLS